MNNKSQSPFHGIACFMAGFDLIRQRGLRRFIAIPLMINTVLFSVAGWVLWHYLTTTVETMLPSWLAWLSWLILPVFMVSVLTVVYYGFTLLANIIAAPFYGQLAKCVEAHLRGEPLKDVNKGSLLKEAPQLLGSEIRKLLYYLVRAVPLLLLSLIPGVNVISLPLWLIFNAWFLTFEYTGYTFENHHVLFNEQKQILQKSRVSSMAFGGMNLFAMSIPIFNFFAPAMAVAGATKMLFEQGELD
ncbi:MAG: cysteine biosynthesis protein CysZ [Cycloclasticus sp. symbiont of Bathymodiolus heckerae]|nr:MAG: cysteine biosynthesis protein CysZ [Cycloclasticus sp. symbiont of Bathymodiolus heckerae]